MTITFRCPGCDRICGFRQEHAGKRARCQKCQSLFIIPSENGGKAKKYEDVYKCPEEPVPGFFQSLFFRSWRAMANIHGVTGLVFVVAAVVFKFFCGHANYIIVMPGFALVLPIGMVIRICAWGCVCWYGMEIIGSTALDIDDLPEVEIGKGLDLIWNVLKSIYLFAFGLALSLLPFFAIAWLLERAGIEWDVLRYCLTGAGLFCFPMVILILSAGKDLWMVFRWDWIVLPIFKAIGAYATTASLVLLSATIFVFAESREYNSVVTGNVLAVVGYLMLNVIGVILLMVAMRGIGLFCRHYYCYMPWA